MKKSGFVTKKTFLETKKIYFLVEIKIFRTKLLFSEAKSTFYASETGLSIT